MLPRRRGAADQDALRQPSESVRSWARKVAAPSALDGRAHRPQNPLGPDKGINLPDSMLALPALTEKDLRDLEFVASRADLVGLSFVQRSSDVEQAQAELARRRREDLGIVLKIETRAALENLADLLLTAMPAMGERAECVIPNKGPHILEAVDALDDILSRMEAH
jgi:hypothetical protein